MEKEYYNPDGKFIGRPCDPPDGDIAGRLKEYAETTGQDYREMLEGRGLSPESVDRCLVTAILGSFPEIHEQWLLFGTCPLTMKEVIEGQSTTEKKRRSKEENARIIKRIQEFARESGITLYVISKESGISQAILYNAKAGRTRLSPQTMQRLFKTYPALKQYIER